MPVRSAIDHGHRVSLHADSPMNPLRADPGDLEHIDVMRTWLDGIPIG